MSAGWITVRVRDLQDEGILLVEDGNHGEYRPRPAEFGSGDTHFIRAADMASGTVLFDTASRISDVARDRIRKGIGAGGDVLFSHKGTVGKLALVPQEPPPFVCSPQTTFWRVLDEMRLSRHFLFYYMQSWGFKAQWSARKGETDMADYVSLTAQRELLIPLPPLDVQEPLVRVLSSLDDKIELNREMNRTLEAMAQAIFRSWFVDFDPVVAKADGREPFGMDAETAALFPDRFVDSELGPIPEGWEVGDMEWLVDAIPGRSYSSAELEASSTALVSLKSFHRGGGYRPDGLKDYVGKYKPEQVLKSGDIALARTDVTQGADVIGNVLRVPAWAAFDRQLVASLDLLILRPRGDVPRELVYHLGRSHDWVSHMVARANGTTVLHLAKDAVPTYRWAHPERQVMIRFGDLVRPFHDLNDTLGSESQTLAELRDLLLPKLLSGEIRVPEAEEIVEDIA